MRRLAIVSLLCALALAAPAAAATTSPRIVGGAPVTQGDYPWQVALLMPTLQGPAQYCGGTLVARQWVITADHCDTYVGDEIRIGSIDRSSGGERIQIDEVRRHPAMLGRVPNADPQYDVNLLHLAQPVTDARPLVIAGAGDSALWADGTSLTITGWGDTAFDAGTGSRYLLQATVPRTSDAYCDSVYSSFDAAQMFCAGRLEGGVDTCQGDSGGPIIAPTVASPSRRNPAHWRLIGVTSFGYRCAEPGFPGVYARLAAPSIADWVTSQLPVEPPVDTGETGTSPPPPEDRTDAEDGGQETVVEQPVPVVNPTPVAPTPVVSTPPAAPVTPVNTTTTPEPAVAEVSRIARRCTAKRRCTFTVAASGVAKLTAKISSTVRTTCRRARCARVVVQRRLTVRRSTGGFTVVTGRLRPGRHVLTVVAHAAGEDDDEVSYRLRFTLR